MPSLTLSYRIRQLTLHDIRKSAEASPGYTFGLSAFRDELVKARAMPLNIPDVKMAAYLAACAFSEPKSSRYAIIPFMPFERRRSRD